jgi:hypothetical protein
MERDYSDYRDITSTFVSMPVSPGCATSDAQPAAYTQSAVARAASSAGNGVQESVYLRVAGELDRLLEHAGVLRQGETASVIGLAPSLDALRQAYVSARLCLMVGSESAMRTMHVLEANYRARSASMSAARHNIAAGIALAHHEHGRIGTAQDVVFEQVIRLLCDRGLLMVRPNDAVHAVAPGDYAHGVWMRIKHTYCIRLVNKRTAGYKFHSGYSSTSPSCDSCCRQTRREDEA